MALPDDVAEALARGLGAYIRAVPRHELPNSLRPLQAFRPKALAGRRGILLAALDDENFRNDVLTWLRESKPDLPREDVSLVRIACERPDAWEEQLAQRSQPAEADDDAAAADRDLATMLEQERERARRARADAKRARARAATDVDALERRIVELERDLGRARDEVAQVRADLEVAERRRGEAETARDKYVRRAERAADAARAAQDVASRDLKAVRKEAVAARRDAEVSARRIDALEAKLARARERPAEEERSVPEAGRERRPLDVPKGRFEDDPQTLEQWLSADGVILLVDGYNVTKAEGGFGSLDLESQRDRLVSDLVPLVQRKKVRAVVVFDGSDVDVAARRAFRGPVKVEYSAPGEIADDHLVELLRGLPPAPVVVVTSDRELQDRLRAHGATIATNRQLLALIR